MLLEHLFRLRGFPVTAEFVGRLRVRMEENPNSVDADQAKMLFDELRHMAVRTFDVIYTPE